MSKTLDEAVELMDAALLAAAHDRLGIALTNAVHIAAELYLPTDKDAQAVTTLLAELEVARCAADAIRQAQA